MKKYKEKSSKNLDVAQFILMGKLVSAAPRRSGRLTPVTPVGDVGSSSGRSIYSGAVMGAIIGASMSKILKRAILGKTEYTPKNGRGYDVSADKEYTVKYDLLDSTFDVV